MMLMRSFWRGLILRRDEWESGRVALGRAMAHLISQAGLALADAVPDPPPHLHRASDGMLRHTRSQLARLHQILEEDIPDPVVGAFADWRFDPFGGGGNFWALRSMSAMSCGVSRNR